MINAKKLFLWYKNKGTEKKEHDIEQIILELGKELKNSNYEGIDVNKSYPRTVLSTGYGFCCNGWINLYKIYGRKKYLNEAEKCIERILDMQTEEGLWLFPYPFEGKSPDIAYACENFMTLDSLLKFYVEIEELSLIKNSVFKAIEAMIKKMGYTKHGCFFYSPGDKIRVPNISSMAASIFSKVGQLFQKKEYIEKAVLFSSYCTKNQNLDGGFRYFEENKMVYIPYHALELWELTETNLILKNRELDQSIQRALNYLKSYLLSFNYMSKTDEIKMRILPLLFKTPLWSAKAFLRSNDMYECNTHFTSAITLFKIPHSSEFFYYLYGVRINNKLLFYLPDFDSIFLRYNASCFEIGSEILRVQSKGE